MICLIHLSSIVMNNMITFIINLKRMNLILMKRKIKQNMTASKIHHQPLPPCPAPYSSHITTANETQVTNVNKIKETNTHKTNNGK